MIAPILLYGCEVWGIENVEMIDKFQLKFLKLILRLKQSTPNCMIYGDLGILPLSVHIKSRILCFWHKVCNSKQEKISNILYRTTHYLYQNSSIKLPWLSHVHKLLDSLGLSNYWLNYIPSSPNVFKNNVKTRLKDQYMQNWHSTIMNSSKCLNYRMYKLNFKLEQYFDILPTHLANVLFRFRCMNHKLPIEKGRFHNIPREQRICHLCNTNSLGDEFHYLFECKFLTCERKMYVPRKFSSNPNSLTLEMLMNTQEKDVLVKLAVFCKHIMNLFQ